MKAKCDNYILTTTDHRKSKNGQEIVLVILGVLTCLILLL